MHFNDFLTNEANLNQARSKKLFKALSVQYEKGNKSTRGPQGNVAAPTEPTVAFDALDKNYLDILAFKQELEAKFNRSLPLTKGAREALVKDFLCEAGRRIVFVRVERSHGARRNNS